MSTAPNMEEARRLLEELGERVGGFAGQRVLKAEVLDGLTRALDALTAASGEQAARRDALPDDMGGGPCGDRTCRTAASEEYPKLNRTLQARSRSNHAMISATDEMQYLREVCRIVVEDCGHAMVWIGYAEQDADKTVRPVASAGFGEGYLETLNITWADSERGRGPTGTAIRRGKPCVCADMHQDPKFAPWRGEALKRGYASSAVLPLMDEGRAFGAISIYSREPDAFSTDEVALLSELAQDLSFGIQSIRLRQAHAQSEELLRRSEERYRSIVELSPDAIFVNQDGRVSYVNPAGMALFGAADPGQILGRSPFDLFHPEYHPEMRRRIETLFGGGSVPLTEARIVRLDGMFRDVEVAASRYDAHEGRAIQVVLRDVTDRKRAEEALAREQASLESVFDVANFGILLIDGRGEVKRLNKTLARWIGRDLLPEKPGQPGDLVGCIHALANPAGCGRTEHCGACAIRGAFESALRSGKPVHNVETESTLLVNGTEVRLCLEISADPLVLDGQPHVVLGMSNITDRKRAENALQREKNRLDAVMAALPVGVAITDTRGGTIQSNRMFDEVWGEGRPATEKVDDYAAYRSWWADSGRPVQPKEWASALAVEKGESVIGQMMKIQRFDGSSAFVINSAAPVFDVGGDIAGSVVAIQDVTELRKAQEALRDSERLYRAIGESINYGVWVCDPSGRNIYASESFLRLVGLTQQQCADFGWGDVLHPDDAERTIAAWKECVQTGGNWDIEHRFRGVDGEWHPVLARGVPIRDERGEVTCWAGINLDVSGIKRAKDALHDSEERVRLALEAGAMATWDWRVPTGEVLWNDEHYRMLGYGVGEVKPGYDTWAARLHPDDRPAIETVLRQSMETGTDYAVQFRVRWPNGETHWVEARGRTERDADGQPIRNYGVMLDITERRQLEEVQNFLAQTAAESQEEPFFDALARYLAQSLGMEFVCIDRLEGDGLTARTVSVWCDDHFEDNVTYALKDTPCGDVVGKTVCCFPASVCQFFPRDEVLQDLRAESYMGVTLWSHTGQPIGLIAVIGRHPLANRPLAEAVLKLVAVRAAGELERLDAKEALRESEERFRVAAQCSNDFIYERNIQTGRAQFFGDIDGCLGYAPGAFPRTLEGWMEHVHPDDLSRVMETILEKFQQGGPYDVDYRLRTSDGSYAEWSDSGVILRDASGTPVKNIGAATDITARRRAEEALRESREDLNRAQAVAHTGSWRLDVRKNELLWSDENWRIFGLPQGAPLTYETFLGTVHPEDRAYVDERWSAGMRGEPYDVEHRIVVGDTVKWVRERAELECDADGRLLSGFGTTQDITESRRAEEALQESEERYRSLFNGMTEGFALHEIVTDDQGEPCDYRFLEVNPAFERLTGLKREDITGRRLREVLPDEDSSWIGKFGQVALTGEAVHFEDYSPALDRWYEVFAYCPAPRQFAVIFMDITARKQAETALARRDEDLRQALRLGRSFTFEWNVATDRVVSGEGAAEVLGLSVGELEHETGADYFRRVHPDDLAPFEQVVHGLTPENDSYRTVYRVIRPDGTEVWLEEIARASFDARGGMERLAGIAADVTERMRAQAALRRSHEELERRVDERTAELRAMNEALQREMEARKRAKEVASRLAAIVSSSDDAILSKTPDGIILTWNRGAERLLGYSEAEVVGRHVAFLTPEDRSDETKRMLDRIQRGERIEHFETVRLTRDGSRVDVSLTISPIFDATGALTGASEIAHDITERKRMEDELRQASEYARSLIEASLDPLATIGLSGGITDVNAAMERMTGVSRRELIGSGFAQYFTEPEKAMEGFDRVLRDGKVTDLSLTVRHASDGTTDVLVNATVYRNTAGEVQGVFAAARDITRRKRAEEELARYREHLEDLVRQRTAQLEIAYHDLQEDMAARKLLEAERLRLFEILEATPDMVSYSDASGKVLYLNQSARKLLGIPPGADLENSVIRRPYPEWADKVLREFAVPTVLLEGTWRGETAVLDAEGNEIPVSQVIIAHHDASGQLAFFSTIARDMTAQKRAERDLKALASFPAENPSPVLRTTEDGLLLYANEAAARLLDAWGCAVHDRVPPQVRKRISSALNRGKVQEDEYQADGLVYSVLFAPVHETGHVNLYGRDITERRRMEDALVQARDDLEQRVQDRTAELLQVNTALVNKIEEHARTARALRNSQARLAEAQRIAHLGAWEWELATGALTWSDEVFRIFGLSPREQAPTFPEFLGWTPAEDRTMVEQTAQRSIAEKKPFSLNHRIVLPGGEIRHVHAQAEMTLDETGVPLRMLGTIMDITERVRAEEGARIHQQQLIQADKMVSLGILVAGVAHEINNPNHSIMSNVTALAGVWDSTRPILDRFYEDFGDFVLGGFEYSECRDKLPDMFANALANSKRIEVIVTELRDFARNSPRESMAPVDVNAVVNSAIILMGNTVKKSTDHFSVAYGEDVPPVLGNFQRIEQVVINLIQNACQALASRDRSVRVATSHDPDSGKVLLVVCDEGVGIPEENTKQLGTPFFTTKRGSEGMGLGLWISTNIAHEHGGTLTFSPREGGGTRAVLALPANGRLAVNTPVEREL